MRSLLLLLLVVTSISYGQDEFISTVNKAKADLRSELDTLQYDGTQVTYFKYRDQTYYKGVQVPVFLRDRYYFLFSGAAANEKVSIEFYDKPPESNNRLLLFEIKNISEDEAFININDLRERMKVYGESPDDLRSVFVDYKIKKGKGDRGAIVLVLGYADNR